jgi:crossover junction endodeoxyribonuclease RusA
MSELRLEIPLVPPSGNNYTRARIVTPRSGKPFISWYHTEEAKAWWNAVAAVAGGRQLRGASYTVSYVVWLPTKARRDVDNFAKCCLDALTKCGAIDDDSGVTEIHGYKRLDRANPRTVIVIRSEQGQMF